jgi:hypothetical protein
MQFFRGAVVVVVLIVKSAGDQEDFAGFYYFSFPLLLQPDFLPGDTLSFNVMDASSSFKI